MSQWAEIVAGIGAEWSRRAGEMRGSMTEGGEERGALIEGPIRIGPDPTPGQGNEVDLALGHQDPGIKRECPGTGLNSVDGEDPALEEGKDRNPK